MLRQAITTDATAIQKMTLITGATHQNRSQTPKVRDRSAIGGPLCQAEGNQRTAMRPAASCSSATRCVLSQMNSGSLRPKCPPAVVWR